MPGKESRFALFRRDVRGGVSISFALAAIPMLIGVGAAVDFGRALALSTNVQAAVDQAALAATAMTGTDADKKAKADALLLAALHRSSAVTNLVTNADGTVNYSAQINMPTMFVPFIAANVTIKREASAKATVAGSEGTPGTPGIAGWTDNSCILTLGEDINIGDSDYTMTFNGAPSINLTGCTLRSNDSITCNGHSTQADKSIARGSVNGSCPNKEAGAPEVIDVYAATAGNITRLCGAEKSGYTWALNGTIPTVSTTTLKLPAVAPVAYHQVHVCGTLSLSGTRQLLADAAGGTEPDKDLVIVIENGGIELGDEAAITAKRVTFVLAGANPEVSSGSAANPVITWPNGRGKEASLISTPSIDESNPFKGFSVYQDPGQNFNQNWKPGANARFDGILYMPRAQLTLSGNMQYGAKECVKIVVAQFTSNGNVGINLKQSAGACAALNMSQYTVAGTPAVEAVAGTEASPARLTR